MANEWDRQIIPALFQTGITISLGAAYRGLEMMKDPQKTITTMSGEMKELLTVPVDSGDGIEAKTKALAGVWMEKGMTAVESCRNAGRKFTGDE